MDCLLCGREVIYQGLLKQECPNEACDNYSHWSRDIAEDERYDGWEYNERLEIWVKYETY
jgi:hypothetical protein